MSPASWWTTSVALSFFTMFCWRPIEASDWARSVLKAGTSHFTRRFRSIYGAAPSAHRLRKAG